MIRILSLKLLSNEEIDFLRKHLSFEIEYFIPFEIQNVPINVELNPEGDILIFTSQNALKSISDSIGYQAKDYQCICIEGKTSELARKMGFSVLFSAKSAKELVNKFDHLSPAKRYVHLCVNDRLDTISEYFRKKKNLRYIEAVVYEKKFLNPSIQNIPNAVLAFSPSGIVSLESVGLNKEDTLIICIGETTLNQCRILGYKKCFAPNKPDVKQMLNLLIERIHFVKKID